MIKEKTGLRDNDLIKDKQGSIREVRSRLEHEYETLKIVQAGEQSASQDNHELRLWKENEAKFTKNYAQYIKEFHSDTFLPDYKNHSL